MGHCHYSWCLQTGKKATASGDCRALLASSGRSPFFALKIAGTSAPGRRLKTWEHKQCERYALQGRRDLTSWAAYATAELSHMRPRVNSSRKASPSFWCSLTHQCLDIRTSSITGAPTFEQAEVR